METQAQHKIYHSLSEVTKYLSKEDIFFKLGWGKKMQPWQKHLEEHIWKPQLSWILECLDLHLGASWDVNISELQPW